MSTWIVSIIWMWEIREKTKKVMTLLYHYMLFMGLKVVKQCMWWGKSRNKTLVMLIDSGSTHNFIDQAVAKRLRCTTKVIDGIKVIMANGDVLKVQEICELVR